jgi:hypothetical protein
MNYEKDKVQSLLNLIDELMMSMSDEEQYSVFHTPKSVKYKKKNGDYEEDSDFIPIEWYGSRREEISNFLETTISRYGVILIKNKFPNFWLPKNRTGDGHAPDFELSSRSAELMRLGDLKGIVDFFIAIHQDMRLYTEYRNDWLEQNMSEEMQKSSENAVALESFDWDSEIRKWRVNTNKNNHYIKVKKKLENHDLFDKKIYCKNINCSGLIHTDFDQWFYGSNLQHGTLTNFLKDDEKYDAMEWDTSEGYRLSERELWMWKMNKSERIKLEELDSVGSKIIKQAGRCFDNGIRFACNEWGNNQKKTIQSKIKDYIKNNGKQNIIIIPQLLESRTVYHTEAVFLENYESRDVMLCSSCHVDIEGILYKWELCHPYGWDENAPYQGEESVLKAVLEKEYYGGSGDGGNYVDYIIDNSFEFQRRSRNISIESFSINQKKLKTLERRYGTKRKYKTTKQDHLGEDYWSKCGNCKIKKPREEMWNCPECNDWICLETDEDTFHSGCKIHNSYNGFSQVSVCIDCCVGYESGYVGSYYCRTCAEEYCDDCEEQWDDCECDDDE